MGSFHNNLREREREREREKEKESMRRRTQMEAQEVCASNRIPECRQTICSRSRANLHTSGVYLRERAGFEGIPYQICM